MILDMQNLKSNPVTKPILKEAGLVGEEFLKKSDQQLINYWKKYKPCQKAFPTKTLFLNYWKEMKK